MKVVTYSEARRRLAELLDTARDEEVLIRRRSGEVFSLRRKPAPTSPFDVPGVSVEATTDDILAAIQDSRAGTGEREGASDR